MEAQPVSPIDAIYLARIQPLAEQLVAICRAHGIPMVAAFQVTDAGELGEGSPPAHRLSTTAFATENALRASESIRDAVNALLPYKTKAPRRRRGQRRPASAVGRVTDSDS